MPGSGREGAAKQPQDIFRDSAHPPDYAAVHDRVFGRCCRAFAAEVRCQGEAAHRSVADDDGFVAGLLAYCAGFDSGFQAITPSRMPESEDRFHRRFAMLTRWRLRDRERLRRVRERRQPEQTSVDQLGGAAPAVEVNSPDRTIREWVNVAEPTDQPARLARLEAAVAYFLHHRADVPLRLVAQALRRDPATVHRRLGVLPKPCRDVASDLPADDQYDEQVMTYARNSIALVPTERLHRLRAAAVYTLARAEVSMHEVAEVLRCHRATAYRLRLRLSSLFQ